MKKAVVLTLIIGFLLFAACVPTPDHEFVVNKAEIDTDTVLHATAAPSGNADLSTDKNAIPDSPHDGVLLSDRIGAPAHWSEDAFSKQVPFDTLTVEIDADVFVPDTERVGVYTATFDVPFSETQQKGLVLKYLGDERPFKADVKEYWRKWQIEEEIRELQQALEYDNAIEDKKMRDNMLQQDNRHLQSAMDRYNAAPEDWDHVDWDGTYASGRGEQAKNLLLYANTDQPAHYKKLSVTAYGFSYSDETQPTNEDSRSRVSYRDATAVAPETDGERAAAELALNELHALGIGTFTVKSVESSIDTFWRVSGVDYPQTGYLVHLWHTVDGLPFYDFQAWHGDDNLMNHVEETGMKEAPDYSVYMPGQYRAEVGVRDGKVVSVFLEGTHHVTGCVNEDVQLLPFEKIVETFKEQIAYHYYTGDWEDPDSGNGETLHITGIRLSMMRVRKKDSPEEFYLLPVWDFTGYTESALWPMTPEEFERHKEWAIGLTFLTVNAVDGSVIDRDLGY